MDELWLLPSVGCAQLQTINDFGVTRTYQRLVDLKIPFADVSVLTPQGTEDTPFNIEHASYLYRMAKDGVDAGEAERRWADLSRTDSPAYASIMRNQATWEQGQKILANKKSR